MPFELTNYRSAGVLLAREIQRPEWMSRDLLPPSIISASACISPQFPGVYTLEWCSSDPAGRAAEFARVGIGEEQIPEVRAWATANFDRLFGWEAVWFTVEAALQARERFLKHVHDIRVIELALHEKFCAAFLTAATPPPPVPGFSPQGESGYFTVAKLHRPPGPQGTILGFELLNVEYGAVADSWLCNGLESHCSSELGIRPSPNGLLASENDAERCCSEISRDEVGAEPGLWLPWLVLEHGVATCC